VSALSLRPYSDTCSKRPDIISGNSFFHFHLMLRQAIDREGLKHPEEWERVLSTLLLKVSTHLQPNVRSGDSIDVRTYVKIKKIPGGKISDSEYVDGIVITKNVAHKQMARHLVNPRIMVLTFPLDYHRVENQFMSLEPLVTQEKDYLRLLTKRVIDVRPHIVLVERSASRIALDFLLDANIAVARSVKPSAIHQVARCTQADVIASMDRLALEPRLGRCADFRIQTYEHDLIPGRRKTFMRFEGCQREYGCTLVLRGGDIETLRKVKRVADFMALVVYNLKLEVCLFNDEHNMLPPQPQLSSTVAFERPDADLLQPGLTLRDNPSASPVVTSTERKAELEAQERLTREIQASLAPYLETALSASAAVAFPPPAPLAKMADLDRSLAEMRQKRDEAEAVQILVEEGKVSAVSAADLASSTATLTQAAVPAPGINIPATSTEEPATTEGVTQTSIPSTSTSDLAISPVSQSQTTARPRDASRDPYRILRLPEEIAQDAALAQTEHNHAEQLKLWSWYTKRNKGSLRPEDYQGIVFLYSLVCEGTDRPCVGPQLQSHNYYQADDCTLGQFLEDLTADAVKPCPSKSCERLQLFHFRLLVHGQTRLQIAMDQFACPSPGHEDKIITWSYCRICSTPSPTAILRDETWKISWGAYLEHCFYPPMARAGFSCPHDAYRDQIRYFAHRNLAIRIHNEEIDLYETVRPSIILRLRPALKVALKNQEYESALAKNAAYFDSVLFRLKVFDYDVVQPERVSCTY
jgi:1-phosphatidylinositol-3-phosphate 5-kinase